MDQLKSILDRAKNLQYFEVTIQLEEPLQFRGGRVPFDIKATESVASFNVLAESYEEAEADVWNWIRGQDE